MDKYAAVRSHPRGQGGDNMKLEMTYELAHAISLDAGNRSMRAAGRFTWNEEDRDVAVAIFNKCLPAENLGWAI